MVKATKNPSSGGGKKISSKKGGSSKKKSSMPSLAADDTAAADAAAPSLRPDTPSLGMRTSSIANKLVRKEQYAKLKHKQKVNRREETREEREGNEWGHFRRTTAASSLFVDLLFFSQPRPLSLSKKTPKQKQN